MKIFPSHKGRFIASTVVAAYLLLCAGIAISNGSFSSLAGAMSGGQVAQTTCWIPGVGCGGGASNTETLTVTILQLVEPYYGGKTSISIKAHGYKTKLGVTASCKFKNQTTGAESSDQNSSQGESSAPIGRIYGLTPIKIKCTNQYNTYATSDDTKIYVNSAPEPEIVFTVNPEVLEYGGTPVISTANWKVTNEAGCKLQGPGINTPLVKTASECAAGITTPLTFNAAGTYTYELFYDTDPSATQDWVAAGTKTVRVTEAEAELEITADDTPNTVGIEDGDTTTIEWNSTNVETGTCQVSNNRNSTRWSGPTGSQITGPHNQTIIYTLTCKEFRPPKRTVTKSVSVIVAPALAPTCTLTAPSGAVPPGTPVTLSYTIPGAPATLNNSSDGATISPTVGPVPRTPTGSVSVSPTVTTTYTMTVRGPGGTGTCGGGPNSTVTVQPTTPTPPTTPPTTPTPPVNISLTANPSRVQQGNNTTLNWSSSNATSCRLTENSAVISTALSGAGLQRPITRTTVYTLTCSNSNSTQTRSQTVTVVPIIIEQ